MPEARSPPLQGARTDTGSTDLSDGRMTVSEELWDMTRQAIQTFLPMVAWAVVRTIDASIVGHTGVENMAAVSWCDLWTSCTAIFIAVSVLGTFGGQEYGRGNKQMVGVWTQVSIFTNLAVGVPVLICYFYTEQVISWLGHADLAPKAGYYAKVFAVSIPSSIIRSRILDFFTLQKILHPGRNSTVLLLVCNVLFGYYFVLGAGPIAWVIELVYADFKFDGFGFAACPWVSVCLDILQLLFIYIVEEKFPQRKFSGT